MKAPFLVSVVVMLHVAAVGTLVLVQGCGTTQPAVEPPPAPVMPPPAAPDSGDLAGALKPPAPELPRMAPKPAPELPKVGAYTVKSGDSMERIARRHKIPVRELAELNNVKDLSKIRVGQKLLIPGFAGEPASPKPVAPRPAAKPAVRPPAPPSGPLVPGGEYVVQPGDYLGKVAVKHGVKTRDLRSINGLKSDMIRPGQKLIIPAGGKAPEPAAAPAEKPEPVVAPNPPPEPVAPPPAVEPAQGPAPAPTPPAPAAGSGGAKPISYPVSEGETVESIAKAFLVSPDAIRAANSLSAGQQPSKGQSILIPIPE